MFIHIKDHRINKDQILSYTQFASKLTIVTKDGITYHLDFDSKKHAEAVLEYLDVKLEAQHIEFVEPPVGDLTAVPTIKVSVKSCTLNSVTNAPPIFQTVRIY